MEFREEFEGIMDEDALIALGKLLITYQALEEAIREACEFIPEEDLPKGPEPGAAGLVGYLETSVKRAAKRYRVSSVDFSNRYPVTIVSMSQVESVFAGVRFGLKHADRLLKYRNKLFHGKVEVASNNVVRFRVKGGGKEPATREHFHRKRQQVLATIFVLDASFSGLPRAVQFLQRRRQDSPIKADDSSQMLS